MKSETFWDIRERELMLRAMDFIVRHLNDEEQFEPWLLSGVPDDADDETFFDIARSKDECATIMRLFLDLMQTPKNDLPGTLYCGGVLNE